MAATQQQRIRWGDLEEDDGLNSLLPPPVTTGPDENGVKTVIEYRFDEETGQKVKVTTTTRVRSLGTTRLSKKAVERRSWARFGDAENDDASSHLTMVSTEEIVLERPRAKGSKVEEESGSGDQLGHSEKGGGTLMVCRTCGKKGDHWTAKCPYKELKEVAALKEPAPMDAPVAPSTYVPPRLRAGPAGTHGHDDMRRRNDENSVRVSNLSEDAREPDLLELFSNFGPISRVYVALDQRTGTSRGFGFVNFVHREDAEKASSKLDGYGYDSLILRVEWAAPRPTNN